MKKSLIIASIAISIFAAGGNKEAFADSAEETSKATENIEYTQEYNNGYINGNKVNFRKGPSTSTGVIRSLKSNTRVTILGNEGEWVKVKNNNQTGYVHGKYVSKDVVDKEAFNKEETTAVTLTVKATAYAGDEITSTGNVPVWGTIAVDPNVIPYGSKVYIPELDKIFIAEDCGSAIKGNRIDIFMNSETDCNEWGVREVTAYILE